MLLYFLLYLILWEIILQGKASSIAIKLIYTLVFRYESGSAVTYG